MILIGDIGGTKARLSFVKRNSKNFLYLKIYRSKNFSNIYHLLNTYFSEINIKEVPEIALIAVAGPVIKNSSYLPNLGWKVSGNEIQKKFNIKKVILVNDLVALAGSIMFLKKDEILKIKNGKKLKKFPKAFIAPGTGLGEAIFIKDDPLLILPTEGGHLFFSPLNEEEFNYLEFLKAKNEELSWEKALSGKALSYWYEFFFNKKLEPEKIIELAKNEEEKSIKVVKKFFELLGRKVSQIALYSLPEGGIYIAGGVVQGIKVFFEKEEYKNKFLEGYYRNEKMKEILEKFSINVITYSNPGLLGVLAILRNLSK